MKNLTALITLSTLFFSSFAHSDVLILVHGYLGSAHSWEQSGINTILEKNNWHRGGLFTAGSNGPQLLTHAGKDKKNKVYVVDLPSESPVMIQANLLTGMLNTVRGLHKDEPLIIVGHSAGGVVARMALITGGSSNASALITIASPHIGTTRAEDALNVTANHGPFNIVKNVFGGSGYNTLQRSKGLLIDLIRPRPGNMLFWLNAQKHPDIDYVSVVRTNPVGFAGDDLVPGYSQDMNNVPALKGKSAVFTTPQGHTLEHYDGDTIVQILKHLNEEH